MKASGKRSDAAEFLCGMGREEGWQKARLNLRADIVMAQLCPSETHVKTEPSLWWTEELGSSAKCLRPAG